MPGPLALVGGAEWTDGCAFDRELFDASGAAEVLVLPTAAAYERPERAVETATRWFESLGAKARGLMVLSRPDAEDEANAAAVRDAKFLYLGGGSPLHLRSVL
ncbi:MAG: Type 1 glutamine amidotransferase-like domain-containing protein, partial [Actinobacteria bacterium]|nr:Type 1 glutamine amidotransferase-like domain-containing protein [Actinomycetota bacterium]